MRETKRKSVSERERERERESKIEREREKDRETERQRETKREREREREREKERDYLRWPWALISELEKFPNTSRGTRLPSLPSYRARPTAFLLGRTTQNDHYFLIDVALRVWSVFIQSDPGFLILTRFLFRVTRFFYIWRRFFQSNQILLSVT